MQTIWSLWIILFGLLCCKSKADHVSCICDVAQKGYTAFIVQVPIQLRSHILCIALLQVIKLISQVIADFANGEISQQQKVFDTSITLEEYMDKNFYKTASLIAASCKSAAVFSDCSQDVKDSMFEYGRHLGLAFQIIDDILDFTQTAQQLGKPQVRLSEQTVYIVLC